jgi:hypothetical protein
VVIASFRLPTNIQVFGVGVHCYMYVSVFPKKSEALECDAAIMVLVRLTRLFFVPSQ